jgi:Protein of unknown function (DUF2778)
MPWTYSQSTGKLTKGGKTVATGYSGSGAAKNKPDQEGVANSGPIPKGKYRIGRAKTSVRTGPVVMDLSPTGHTALGRSAFQIHGDNKTRSASHGCIILDRATRQLINKSTDKTLEVVE